jgi:hypothetical protein
MNGKVDCNGTPYLRSIGVGTSISHGKNSPSFVLEIKVFIFELFSVNGFSSSSIVVGKVSAW